MMKVTVGIILMTKCLRGLRCSYKVDTSCVFVLLSEIDRKLRAVNSLLLSPEPQDRRSRCRRGLPSPDDDDVIIMNPNDDDVIIMNPNSGHQDSPYSSSVREIPLKIRCRTDVHKIPVLSVRTPRRH